jgi:hypothetical protein
VIVPKVATADFNALFNIATELNRKLTIGPALQWHALRGEDVAFCFQNLQVAISFQVHCASSKVQNYLQW